MNKNILSSVMALALVLSCGTVAAQQAGDDIDQRMTRAAVRVQEIEHRATRIADINELRNLQRIYGYYVDKALWDQVVALFTEDGTMELGLNGVYAGKERIRRYLYSLSGGTPGLAPGQLNNHLQLSPVITLAPDGQSAKGRWRALIQTGTYGAGSGGDWGSGTYENEYVKEDGVWKIRALRLFVRFYAPYEGGWTRAPQHSALRYGKSSVRRSAPPSLSYEAYPTQFTPPFHYENPVTSGYRLVTEPTAATATAEDAALSVNELEARVRALDLQVRRLEAVDEVERLQAIYGYYADKNMQDPTSALFIDDGSLEILGRGVFIGRDRIYEYMRRLGAPAPGSLFNHMQLQPVVHVSEDGNSAQLRARLFVMFAMAGRAAQWGEGIYENTFVRENGVWKYRNLKAYQTFYSNYEDGWAKQASPILGPFPGYPPDLPQSVNYQPYPAVFVPPFHYRNPVTKR